MTATARTLCLAGLGALFLVSSSPCDALGQEKSTRRRGYVGFKVGMIGWGEVRIKPINSNSETTLNTEESYSLGVFGDVWSRSAMSLGISIDISDVKSQVAPDANEMLLEFGAHVSRRFATPDGRLVFRAASGFGYGIMKEIQVNNAVIVDATHYLTFRLFGELALLSASGHGVLGEVGWLWAVDGGNAGAVVTAGPMWMLRFGVVL
ncbi:MAG TPA: hypothetical protein VMY05_08085 [Acidobacteriota bacterium]|nr:hypothetical protein [Acidobacteriota bacterium]